MENMKTKVKSIEDRMRRLYECACSCTYMYISIHVIEKEHRESLGRSRAWRMCAEEKYLKRFWLRVFQNFEFSASESMPQAYSINKSTPRHCLIEHLTQRS